MDRPAGCGLERPPPTRAGVPGRGRVLDCCMTVLDGRVPTVRGGAPGGPIVKAWDQGVPMEPDVWKQVDNIAAVLGVERIAVMPDAHIGKGACVGSAILTRDIVLPAAVGVDIGCGMIAAPLRLRRSGLRGPGKGPGGI